MLLECKSIYDYDKYNLVNIDNLQKINLFEYGRLLLLKYL